MAKTKRLIFKIKEDAEELYLECNGDLDIGYLKPLQKSREEIIKEFHDRVEKYYGILKE